MRFRAYEEVKIGWDQVKDLFILKSPWVEIHFSANQQSQEFLKTVARNLHNPNCSYEIQEGIQLLLTALSEYPVAFVEPRNLSCFVNDTNSVSDNGLFCLDSPIQLATELVEEYSSAHPVVPLELPFSWQWDVHEVLCKASIQSSSKYDPLTVYGLIKKLTLASWFACSNHLLLFQNLESAVQGREDKFFNAMRCMLRQSYQVTKACRDSVAPAKECFPKARPLIEKFMRDEAGHHRFILSSLRSLGVQNVEALDVLPETILNMAILKASATKSFLAFCCCLSAFESGAVETTDPIVGLLSKSSKPASATGVEQHFRINSTGKHADVGRIFINEMSPVNEGQVLTAVRFSELLSYSYNLMAKRFLQLTEE